MPSPVPSTTTAERLLARCEELLGVVRYLAVWLRNLERHYGAETLAKHKPPGDPPPALQ